jgi:outer membrane murein-binding lipoprotein Lpp
MENKEAYVERIKSKMNEWGVDLDQLRSKIGQATEEAKVGYGRRVEELQAKKDELMKKMDSIKETEGLAWKDLKAGIEKASSDIRKLVEKFRSSSN